jgi:uncharacterized protein with HEPN domain
MMLCERDDVYVEHMLECIVRIERFVQKNRGVFMQSDLVQDAVVSNLQTLSESSQWLSVEARNSQPGIDWRAIAYMAKDPALREKCAEKNMFNLLICVNLGTDKKLKYDRVSTGSHAPQRVPLCQRE